jgi:hypothetical protein
MSKRPWIDRAADRVEGRDLTDEIVISREDPDAVVTDADGVVTASITDIWLGPCLVSPAPPRRTVTVADDRVVEATHRIRLPRPLGGLILPGDIATMRKSESASLVGAVFFVIADGEATARVSNILWVRRIREDPQR